MPTFILFSITNKYFVVVINISKFLQQVFSRGLGRSLCTRAKYKMATYWKEKVIVWDNWGGVQGVGGAGDLHYNGQSFFENQGSIPLQVFTILEFCMLLCEWKQIVIIQIWNMHNLCMYL